jgi:DNA-binding NarL/FixJ family response regulator/tetratricopeptide (TPR) repeat protein
MGSVTRIEVGPLTLANARDVLGQALDDAAASTLFEESGGNPFYLLQLARALDRSAATEPVAVELSSTIEVPSAVAAAITDELAVLSVHARWILQGAAVAGDPFEPELAAAAAAVPVDPTMDAIDELLGLDLIRQTDVPRRFRFRHPLVRRAVYETTPAGWRLRAHERCADALADRGVSAAIRAHHVERSAREGDLDAVRVLREAGEATARLAPTSAANWFAGALRLLPDTASAETRVELLVARARALAATGRFAESHTALLEGLATVPPGWNALRTTLTTACARIEHRLGRYEEAGTRLAGALDELPGSASSDSVALLIELALNEFYRSRYESMHDWAGRALTAARELDDPPLTAAASAMPALAHAMTGASARARSDAVEAAALVDRLSNDELSLRLDAAVWLAAAELYLDLYAEADAHASRALTIARATGQGEALLVLYQILGRAWCVRGKLAEATDLIDGAIEASRLLGSPPSLAGNLFNRSAVALAAGDLEIALGTAQEAVDLARVLNGGFVAAWAGVRLGGVLLEVGEPLGAVEVLVDSAGGDELTLIPGGWRAYCLELLTRCWLALDRHEEAARTAAIAEATAAAVELPLAFAWARRARAEVALHAGDAADAAQRAMDSAGAADRTGAPIEAALSRMLAGRALAASGQIDRAVIQLATSAETLDACGARRYRAAAERELAKLGKRPHRRTAAGRSDGRGVETLTERELEVAHLVVDRRTNAEIAAQLFLSQKTVESHLRNIFHKMGVTSRVALARAVERAG